MNEDEYNLEDRFSTGFFRKGTKDKLTYKNIIADAINWCRQTYGTTEYPNAVKGLVMIIDFDIKGYMLSTRLDEIRGELEEDKKDYIDSEEKRLGTRKIRKRSERIKLKIRIDRLFWENYFVKIIQLLAEHDLLFDTERQIPFKKLGSLGKYGDKE